jgi:hypothetical protein
LKILNDCIKNIFFLLTKYIEHYKEDMEATNPEEESQIKSNNRQEDEAEKPAESSVFFRSEYAKKDFWNSRFEKYNKLIKTLPLLPFKINSMNVLLGKRDFLIGILSFQS